LSRPDWEVYLVNARGTKNLPGRKSDVQECDWLRELHTYGLLRNSFRPPEEIRAVRTIWRQRDRLVKESARAVQQMQKAMARCLACLVYRMVTENQAYVDRSAAYYESKRLEKERIALQRRAATLGLKLVPAI
jgi:cation transport regulator ChaC